jgi:hypothetical protein
VPIVFEDGPAVVVGGVILTVNVTPQSAIDLLPEIIGPFESSGTASSPVTQPRWCWSPSCSV